MCPYSRDYTIIHNENEGENENRSHRYDINRPRSRHGDKCNKYKKCLILMMHIDHTRSQFMRKLSNTEAELKKKKNRVIDIVALSLQVPLNTFSLPI